MDVSVILVNYKTGDLVCDAIDSIVQHTKSVNYEIIVADNGSDDNSVGLISSKYGNDVKIVSINKNLGFGRANNEAVNISKGRNVFLLNPDTRLINNAIKILSDYLDNNSGTGIAGGNLFDADLNPSFSFRRIFPSIFWEINDLFFTLPEKILFRRNAYFNNTGNPLQVAYITGADLMISKALFDSSGGFNPDYFLFFEETDLAMGVKSRGFKIENIPIAKIQHLEGASFDSYSLKSKYYQKGKLVFYNRNYGRIYRLAVDIIIRTTYISRIFMFTLLFNRTKVKFWKTLSAMYSEVKDEFEKLKIVAPHSDKVLKRT